MTQERENVVVEKLGSGVARVTINRPEKRNFLSHDVVRDLASAFERLRSDDTITVVMCTGAGDVAWSSGRDMAHLPGRFMGEQVSLPDQNAIVRHFPKVTMAVVNGYVLAGALNFFCQFDLAIASEENARFGLPEIMHGFPPPSPTATLLWAGVSTKWLLDLVLTGENIDARTAQMIGLVSRVVPHARLHEEAFEWAKKIAQYDRVTLQYCKKIAHACLDQVTYQQACDVAGYLAAEHTKVNHTGRQGLKDWEAGKRIKAHAMVTGTRPASAEQR